MQKRRSDGWADASNFSESSFTRWLSLPPAGGVANGGTESASYADCVRYEPGQRRPTNSTLENTASKLTNRARAKHEHQY